MSGQRCKSLLLQIGVSFEEVAIFIFLFCVTSDAIKTSLLDSEGKMLVVSTFVDISCRFLKTVGFSTLLVPVNPRGIGGNERLMIYKLQSFWLLDNSEIL